MTKKFYVYGGVESPKNEKKLEKLQKNLTTLLLVASYGTFSIGINIRNLHNIVFASPSKLLRNLQSIGRGLRLKDNNSEATLYDISDDLSHNGKENYTLAHFRERINIYNEEDFDYIIHNLDLNNASAFGKC